MKRQGCACCAVNVLSDYYANKTLINDNFTKNGKINSASFPHFVDKIEGR